MRKVSLRIRHDESPESPREWDNLGTMVCWHRSYVLGDEQPREDPDEWKDRDNVPDDAVVLPLYLMDHSGVSINTEPFGCRWDSGQVGWIVATVDAIKRYFQVETVTDDTRTKAESVLRVEVAVYDHYLQGNVWGYEVLETETCNLGHEHSEVTDSCWGFIGDSLEETGLSERDMSGEVTRDMLETAWEERE